MTPHNHPANGSFHTPADIPVDNPPRDPQLVVKRGRPRIYADERERKRANKRRFDARHPGYNTRYARRTRQIAGRLKRIAAARGMTAEALLDEMERG